MGGLRASMEDFSDGLDSIGSDAGSLAEPDAVNINDSMFDEFDPAFLLKQPLFDDAPHERMMDFNKSSANEEAFGTFGEVAVLPPIVPATPTDSGTSSPYVTTPRNYCAMDEQMCLSGVVADNMCGMQVTAPQGLPFMDHHQHNHQHHQQQQQQQQQQSYNIPQNRRSSPSPSMGYGNNNNNNNNSIPPYGNSPPSPPMMNPGRISGFDMNTSPTNRMPPDMISVQSLPNSVQSDLRSASSFDLSHHRTTSSSHQTSSSPVAAGQEIKSFNEAMEKLCESMKRSAMSRNLVKQLSGRNIVKQGSARALSLTKQGSMRSLPRQGSGRFQLAKELSNHSLHTQLSSRSLHKQLSGRSIVDNTGRVTPTSSGGVPVRRMSIDMKHRICTSPGRGLLRQKSSGSLNGRRMQSAMLQIDDNPMGIFYPDDSIHA